MKKKKLVVPVTITKVKQPKTIAITFREIANDKKKLKNYIKKTQPTYTIA